MIKSDTFTKHKKSEPFFIYTKYMKHTTAFQTLFFRNTKRIELFILFYMTYIYNFKINRFNIAFAKKTSDSESYHKQFEIYIKDNIKMELDSAYRKKYENLQVITIDKKYTTILEDAVHILEENKNKIWIVGVHITDITTFSHYQAIFDKTFANKYKKTNFRNEASYLNKLKKNLFYLDDKENKLTYSIIYKIDDIGTILSAEFEKTLISIKKSFTFEEADEILETKKSDMYYDTLNNLKNLITKFKSRYKIPEENIYNSVSKEIIMRLMVLTNLIVKNYLMEHYVGLENLNRCFTTPIKNSSSKLGHLKLSELSRKNMKTIEGNFLNYENLKEHMADYIKKFESNRKFLINDETCINNAKEKKEKKIIGKV